MGLASLDAALSGLRTSQQQISVISNNVSNVNTPGFTRKILPQSSQALLGTTVGVATGIITRNIDLNLERDLWTQVSSSGFYDVQQTYLSRIEQFHGDPSKNLSVAADLSALMDAFSALADSPEDTFLQANTVNQAIDLSNKVNDLAKLINTQRNDAQDEMKSTVDRINDILVQVADLNNQIEDNLNVGRTTALLEDKRDDAVKELANLMDISFFTRGDGVMVIQTSQGAELAGDKVTPLYFQPRPLGPSTYYPSPGTAAGIYVGNPNTDPIGAVDITATNLGGRLGGLVELRDTTFPKQMAQIDELAHKVALRFEEQGLRLFTDTSGAVPLDGAPDPTTLPNPTPVSYVGFALVMRVNEDVINDNSLVQKGTYGAANIQAGDNEVIRRVLEYTFGNVDYQEAVGATDLRVSGNPPASDTLQEYLGLISSNTLKSGRSLTSYLDVNALITSANGALDPGTDTFSITFAETRDGTGSFTVNINLAAAQLQAGATAADQIVAEINAQIGLSGAPAGFASASVDAATGQIILNTRGSIEIGGGTMGQTGLDFLGFADNTGSPIAPNDPYFDVGVGNNALTRIYIEPGDTEVELLAKLANVEGLAVDTVNFALDGFLRLRPGNSYTSPDFGGDIHIVAGTINADPAVAQEAGLAALPNTVNAISALFGSYNLSGGVATNATPITDMGYQSIEDASAITPSYIAFRETLLGPGANISTNIIGASSIVDFAQKMVNEQSQAITLVQSRLADEQALQTVLETQIQNESGVNLDEELGHLITVQTAYSACARVVTAVDELFQELLNAVR